jgi:hypothetical protein
MALGKRKPVQQPLFVATADLIAKPHPFYDALNRALDAHHFDTFAGSSVKCSAPAASSS